MARDKHNIESNCVTLDDYCFDEQDNYYQDVIAMENKEKETVKRTGEKLFNYIKKLF